MCKTATLLLRFSRDFFNNSIRVDFPAPSNPDKVISIEDQLNFLECRSGKHRRDPQQDGSTPPTCRLGRGQSGARPRSSCKATQLCYPQHCGNSGLSLSLPIGVPTQTP